MVWHMWCGNYDINTAVIRRSIDFGCPLSLRKFFMYAKKYIYIFIGATIFSVSFCCIHATTTKNRRSNSWALSFIKDLHCCRSSCCWVVFETELRAMASSCRSIRAANVVNS